MTHDNESNASKPHTSLIAPRRSASIRFAQRKKISRLLTLGHSQSEIAEILDLSESTISREVHKLKEEFKTLTKANVSELQASELSRLAEVETAAWLAHAKTNSDAALNTILKVIRTRAAILGVDSPDVRVAYNLYHEGKQLLIRAVTDVLGDDPQTLLRVASRIEELEGQIQSPLSLPASVVMVEPETAENKLSLPVRTSRRRKVSQ